MPDIMHYLKIHAPPDRIYAAIATAEGVRSWWTRDADLDSVVGGVGEFRFYGGKTVTHVRIDELTPSARIKWAKITSNNAPGEWDGTTITFDLEADGDGTILRFAHRGFPQADDGYAMVTTGWAYYLVSLQQFVQTGTGAPSPDVDFGRMIR